MDVGAIVDGIREAIASGSVTPTSSPKDGENDEVIVSRARTVGINPPDLKKLVDMLRGQKDFSLLEDRSTAMGLSGGRSFQIEDIAQLLLAQTLATGNAEQVITDFLKFLSDDAADVIAVMSLGGLNISNVIELANGIQLMPLGNVPPSIQRGAALGQNQVFGRSPHFNPSAALTVKVRISPVLVPEDSTQAEKFYERQKRERERTLKRLEDAKNCIALLGVFPIAYSFWCQPVNHLNAFADSVGWIVIQGSASPDFAFKKIDLGEAKEVCSSYFQLPEKFREDVLRIPLARLNSAGRERSLVDRAIDLGVALESLLMHDLKDAGELSYKLRLRGAWLDGNNFETRKKTFDLLNHLYDMRSKAVHTGQLQETIENRSLIEKGQLKCADLIKKIMKKGELIDWNSLVLGEVKSPMSAYVISELEVRDPVAIETYRTIAKASVLKYGGRYLVRGGAASLIEGMPEPKSLIVIEFPSMERAREWYGSPEYAEALKVRATALDRRLIFVEGVPG